MSTKPTNYLRFDDTGASASGKTRMWNVASGGAISIGAIAWYAPWRKYVFTTAVRNVILDQDCLREIATFIEAETRKHKDALHKG